MHDKNDLNFVDQKCTKTQNLTNLSDNSGKKGLEHFIYADCCQY